MSGAAKQGKSTLVGAAAAAAADGADWLTGEATEPGSVIWIGAAGESQADEVNRLAVQAGASAAALARVHFMPMRSSARIVAALAKHAPADLRLVIIDSARGLLTADGGDEDRSDDVRRTLGAIAQWQTDHGPAAAVVAIHHMRRDREAKTGVRTRGSGDWLAAVDLIIEFDRTEAGARLTYSGRTGAPSAPLSLTWRGGRFAVVQSPSLPAVGAQPITGRIVPMAAEWLTEHLQLGESLTRAEVDRRTGKRKAKVTEAINRLIEAGAWTATGSGRRGDPIRYSIPAPHGGAETGARSGRDSSPPNGATCGRESGLESGLKSHPIGGRETGRESGLESGVENGAGIAPDPDAPGCTDRDAGDRRKSGRRPPCRGERDSGAPPCRPGRRMPASWIGSNRNGTGSNRNGTG